ncbi:MAG: integral rane sensor signal transduction histidine kinase [Hyphomicrobiales bacterium]|nr:integral rane sensor signal transduction histidine kinase [Hyphomicrobiales bacterium]
MQAVGLSERLPSNIETAVFRIAQEAFTNILKHASATTASVILERRADVLHVVVEDDGCGFTAANVASSSETDYKLGLSSIRERLAILAGSLRIESAPDQGTTLFIEVPLQERGSDDG